MSKIRELLKDPNSVLAFDVDGVLAVMEWGEYNHYGEDDSIWASMVESGLYLYTEQYVVRKMQDFIRGKNKDNIYAISKVFTEFELEDIKHFLSEYYGIKPEHVYAVKNNHEKADVLDRIRKIHPNINNHQLIMIDDTPEVLTNIMETTRYSTAHVSSFLDM